MKPIQKIAPNPATTVNVPLVVTVLSLGGLLERFQIFLAIPLVPVISQAFNVSELSAAWVGSAYGFTYAVGYLIFAPLSDFLTAMVEKKSWF